MPLGWRQDSQNTGTSLARRGPGAPGKRRVCRRRESQTVKTGGAQGALGSSPGDDAVRWQKQKRESAGNVALQTGGQGHVEDRFLCRVRGCEVAGAEVG